MAVNSNDDRVGRALERMYRRLNAGIKFDLVPMLKIMEYLDNPHLGLAAIHVAGTNGKGSVCAMVAAVLKARGLRPGMYTSPHLLRFNERIRIDGDPVENDILAPLIEQVEIADAAQAALTAGRPATFFEFTTALAFLCFRSLGIRIAVVEVGMGGRLDATNVLLPLVSVITRIGIDHAEYLGNRLEDIAREKAGIIKTGRPVVCGAMPDVARAVIDRIALERKAPLVAAVDSVAVRRMRARAGTPVCRVAVAGELGDYGRVNLSFPGGYALENLATAVAALETFSRLSGVEIDSATMARGLSATDWPARLQRIGDDPPMLLDGAHNPDGVEAVLRAVADIWKQKPIALVTGICADKDYPAMLRIFHRRVKRCWAVGFNSDRALPPEDLAAAARRCGDWQVSSSSLPDALEQASDWARECNGIVLIAGSLFLAAEVLAVKNERITVCREKKSNLWPAV